jgi:hypothetical protein
VKGREAPYPVNTKIREYWDELRDWTVQNRMLLFSTNILNIPYGVYVRGPVKGTAFRRQRSYPASCRW